jgi:hypothetical protein
MFWDLEFWNKVVKMNVRLSEITSKRVWFEVGSQKRSVSFDKKTKEMICDCQYAALHQYAMCSHKIACIRWILQQNKGI